jgi:hypothetical protein
VSELQCPSCGCMNIIGGEELEAKYETAYAALLAEQDENKQLRAELAAYKSFADNYIEKRYANLPKLKADLKELEDGRA